MDNDELNHRDLLARLRRHMFSSPVRLMIAMILLEKGEIGFKDLVEALGVTPGSLWSHLTKLKDKGLIRLRYRISFHGPRLVISLTDKGMEELRSYIDLLDKLVGRTERLTR